MAEPFMDHMEIDISGKHFKQLTVLDYEAELNKLPEDHSFIEFGSQTEIMRSSIAGFEIKLYRKYTKYIIYYYVPSGLIAIISCVSSRITFGFLAEKTNKRKVIQNFTLNQIYFNHFSKRTCQKKVFNFF